MITGGAILRSKGDSWNESSLASDPVTGRPVRRLTSHGCNEKPTYHTNTSFTADGQFLVFVTGRGGHSAVMKAHVPTGELTQLTGPVQGLGGRWEVHKCGPSRWCDGAGIGGTTVCMAGRSRRALFFRGRSMVAVHLDSLDERVLVDDIGAEWIEGAISVDPAETHALVTLMPAHPERVGGRAPTMDYLAAWYNGGMTTRYLQVPLAGGPAQVVFEDPGVGCAHSQHCPADGTLVLIDRDQPPKFWCGGDEGRTTRCWILNLKTRQLTPIVPRNAQRFQVHACWSWDGLHVFYHGWRTEGGWYVGVADRGGGIVREFDFPGAVGYGHVSADPRRQAIILDGNVTTDMLMGLDWSADTPVLEPIARHGTEWDSLSGQLDDPHPTTDPAGCWIAFNAARGGASDVFAVHMTP